MEFLETSWPFILGFIVQGEVMMILWFLKFAGEPSLWVYIGAICAILSFMAFQLDYLIGRLAPHFLQRFNLEKADRFLTQNKLLKYEWILILMIRFLFGVRNPIAIWLGVQNYSSARFITFNFLGVLIWIGFWFWVFYVFREMTPVYFQNYGSILNYVSFGIIGSIILFKLIKWTVARRRQSKL